MEPLTKKKLTKVSAVKTKVQAYKKDSFNNKKKETKLKITTRSDQYYIQSQNKHLKQISKTVLEKISTGKIHCPW